MRAGPWECPCTTNYQSHCSQPLYDKYAPGTRVEAAVHWCLVKCTNGMGYCSLAPTCGCWVEGDGTRVSEL